MNGEEYSSVVKALADVAFAISITEHILAEEHSHDAEMLKIKIWLRRADDHLRPLKKHGKANNSG